MEIERAYLCDEKLVEESTCLELLLLNKGGGDFPGMGLIEVLWKEIFTIIDNQLGKEIEFHDVLHGFRSNRGTGTDSLEAKFLHHLVSMRKEVLCDNLLKLHKAYNNMYWERPLEILEGYRIGKRTLWLLRKHWDRLVIVERAIWYYETPLKGFWGVTQGDTLYLNIFNILVDEVIINWMKIIL